MSMEGLEMTAANVEHQPTNSGTVALTVHDWFGPLPDIHSCVGICYLDECCQKVSLNFLTNV